MKKAIVMTLCAAMAVGMIGSVSTVYAADADIASDVSQNRPSRGFYDLGR